MGCCGFHESLRCKIAYGAILTNPGLHQKGKRHVILAAGTNGRSYWRRRVLCSAAVSCASRHTLAHPATACCSNLRVMTSLPATDDTLAQVAELCLETGCLHPLPRLLIPASDRGHFEIQAAKFKVPTMPSSLHRSASKPSPSAGACNLGRA